MTEALSANFSRLIEALKSQSATPINTQLLPPINTQLLPPVNTQIATFVDTQADQPDGTQTASNIRHSSIVYASNIGSTIDELFDSQNSRWQDDQFSSFFNPFSSVSPCNSQTNKLSKRFLTDQRIEELKKQSSSGSTFACKLLEDIFDKQNLKSSNITGRGANKNIVKNKLDSDKIKYIENLAESHYNHNKSSDFVSKIRNAITRHVNKLSSDK